MQFIRVMSLLGHEDWVRDLHCIQEGELIINIVYTYLLYSLPSVSMMHKSQEYRPRNEATLKHCVYANRMQSKQSLTFMRFSGKVCHLLH